MKLNKFDIICIVCSSLSLIGFILVMCHILIAGVLIAVVGMIASIVLYALKQQLNTQIIITYWCLVVAIVLVVLSIIGATSFYVLDLVKSAEVGE